MKRDDWLWLAIRVFGVYVVILAVTHLPNVLNSGLMVYSFQSSHSVVSELGERMRQEQYNAAFNALMASIFALVVLSAAGIYLLCDGKFFFRTMSQIPGRTTAATPGATDAGPGNLDE